MSIEQRFRRAIEKASRVPSRLDRRVLRILHGDVPTFMETPHRQEVDDPDIVVVGVPYEGVKIRDRFTFVPATATLQEPIYARTGADQAPDAIRRNSVYYSLDHSGGLFPERARNFRLADAMKICDAGDVSIDYTAPAEDTLHAAADRVVSAIGRKAVPVVLGGDDTVPYVGVRSVQIQRKAQTRRAKARLAFRSFVGTAVLGRLTMGALHGSGVPEARESRHHRHPRPTQRSDVEHYRRRTGRSLLDHAGRRGTRHSRLRARGVAGDHQRR